MAKHTILGGKAHLYQRDNNRFWQCASFLEGRNRRTSKKCESLAQAKDFAEDHYRRIRMYLDPYFGKMGLSQITAGVVQEYRIS